MNKLSKSLCMIMIFTVMAGCASLRKAELTSGNNPEQAVAEVMQVKMAAQKDQLDVLADEEFTKGSNFLDDASQGLQNGGLAETVVGNAAIAKAFFQDARKTANARPVQSSRILNARGSALRAGVRKSAPLVESMKEIDEKLKEKTKQFSRALSTDDFDELQKKYLVLESKAVQYTELNAAKQAIERAMNDDAEDLAPKSLRTASLDYKAAMNIIAQSPRSPGVYKKSVDESLDSATQLADVMNVILGAKGTPEHIAVQIVKQKRALGELSTSLKSTKQSLASTKQSLEEKEGKLKQTEGILKTQEEQLARASTQVRFQKAMDEAQKVIPSDDALVYQQGTKLIFRLKRINFQSGKAVIPESSKQLIQKVDAIIKKLDAEKVVVEGHTDSVGSADVNKKLSNHRAAAVANYLFSLKGGYKLTYAGYGESYPIVSNETKEGRATNRRVDLVVSVKQ